MGQSVEQGQTIASKVDFGQQLSLKLEFPEGAPKRAVAWLAITSREQVPRFIRWLSLGDRFGAAPFFVDATRGTSLVGSADPIILLHPPDCAATLLVPKVLSAVDPKRIFEAVLRGGMPHSVWGGTPYLHDGLLMKGTGGQMPEKPGLGYRSPLDLAIERLSSRSYRSSSTAMRTLCESALRYPLPAEMKDLIGNVLAEATARGVFEDTDGSEALSQLLSDAALRFETLHLYEGAAALRAIAMRAGEQERTRQLELFDPLAFQAMPAPPKQGIRYIRCSLLPLSFEAEIGVATPRDAMIERDDEVFNFGRVDPRTLNSWLTKATPLTLTPAVSTRRIGQSGTTEITVTMVPKFLEAFDGKHEILSPARSAREKWRISPRVCDRLFSPSHRMVSVGQAATFRTESSGGREKVPLSLYLLTPRNRTVNVSLSVIV